MSYAADGSSINQANEQSVQTSLAGLSDADAPTSIQQLPLELLQTILSHVITYVPPPFRDETDRWLPQPLTFDASSPVWVLSHVSSAWRAAALSLPQLWSNLDLRILKNSLPHNAISILAQLLLRSQGCPLTVKLVIDDVCWDERTRYIVGQVVGVSNRWQCIALQVPGDALDCFNVLDNLDQLLALSIHLIHEDWHPRHNSRFQTALCRATRFRALAMSNGTEHILHWPLPWQQLRFMSFPRSLGSIPRETIRTCLGQMPNVQLLELGYRDEDESGQATILLPHVTRVLCYHKHILADLVIPAIQEVRVFASEVLLEKLIDCIVKSSASLRQLEIEMLPFTHLHVPIMTCLRSLPTLTALHTFDKSFSETSAYLLDALTYNKHSSQNGDVLLPQLEELRITHPFLHPGLVVAAKACIISRWCIPSDAPVQRLRVFRLVIERGTEHSVHIRPGILHVYYEEGLDVSLEIGNDVDEQESELLDRVFGNP